MYFYSPLYLIDLFFRGLLFFEMALFVLTFYGRILTTFHRFESSKDNRLATDQRIREDWIAVEHFHIIGRRLKRCVIEQGVNHYEKCRDLAKEYYDLFHAPKHGALYTRKNELDE